MFRSLPSFVVASAAVLSLGIVAPVQAQELMAASAVANTMLFPVTPLAPAPVARAADDATAVKADAEQTATLSRTQLRAAREAAHGAAGDVRDAGRAAGARRALDLFGDQSRRASRPTR